jgi:hypothetical protein
MLWTLIFLNGVVILLAVVFVFFAMQKDVRGTLRWLLVITAILLLLTEGGRWMVAKGVRSALDG